MTIYSTVPSGLQDVAVRALSGTDGPLARRRSGGSNPSGSPIADKVIATFDGAVLYATSSDVRRIAALGFVQNSFVVVRALRDLGNRPMQTLLAKAAELVIDRRRLPAPLLQGARSFRLVTSVANRLVSPDRRLRDRVEQSVGASLKLPVRRGGADLELWLLARREGSGIIGLRVGERRATERDLAKGELRPELAGLLCCIAGLRDDDRFLDPFCGSGAILAERLRCFPVAAIYGCDTDERKVRETRRRLASIRPANSQGRSRVKTSVETADARELSHLPEGSIDAVVTDPPWGAFDGSHSDPAGLYSGALSAVSRVLAPDCALVVLVGRNGPMDSLLSGRGDFAVMERYEVLVGGRKATILGAGRRREECGTTT